MSRVPTEEENRGAARWARSFNWDERERPAVYDPVQLRTYNLPVGFVDWWSTRSQLFCCCFPLARCVAGRGNPFAVTVTDITDDSIWGPALARPILTAPESLRGVWYLADNIAHENLVLMNDAVVEGDFDAQGTSGFGAWKHSLRSTWSRDTTCFGWILLVSASVRDNQEVAAAFNLEAGKLRFNEREWVFRVDDDMWWKTHFEPSTGEVVYMYRWLRVIRPDGSKTQHWDELVRRATAPLPHRNCFEPWLPCWSCCISNEQRVRNMIYINKHNSVVIPKAPAAMSMR